MPGAGFAPPDLCSIPTAAEQEERAGTVRGGFSAGGCPLGGDDPPASLASGTDRAIRLSTAVAVLAVRYLKPAPSMTRRWPRTGSACRPAIRCRNAG